MGAAGPRVIREIKAFRQRDDLLFGLPYLPGLIVIAVTALMVMYYEVWLGAAAFFAISAGIGKLLARHDPYWLETFPLYCRLPRILAP
jgi:hypothetical protein